MNIGFSFTPLILTIIFSSFFLLLIFNHAAKLKLIDRPTARKQHVGAVPLIGGLSIFVGTWMVLPFLIGLGQAWILLCATTLILIVGLIDDIYPLPVLPRIIIQITAVVIMIIGDKTWLQFLGNMSFYIPMWLGIFLTIFLVVGIINALNMIDGIDGLAGSLSFLTLFSMGILAWGAGRFDEAWVALLFAVSIIPYLTSNLSVWGGKYRIFLGDAGSMVLGFIIAWLAIKLCQPITAAPPVFAPVTVLWLFAIPLVDTVSIMVRRTLKGQSPFLADRDHLHHIVMRMGYGDRHALLFIILLAVILLNFGLWMEFNNTPEWKRILIFIIFFLIYCVLLIKIWHVSKFVRSLPSLIKPKLYNFFLCCSEIPSPVKKIALILTDTIFIYTTLGLAFILRFGDWNAAARYFDGNIGTILIVAPIFAIPAFFWFSVYHIKTRSFTAHSLWSIFIAVALYTFLYATGWLLLRASEVLRNLEPLPISVLIIHVFLLLITSGGFRLITYWLTSWSRGELPEQAAKKDLSTISQNSNMVTKALIYGTGASSEELAKILILNIDIIGFLNEDNQLHGQTLGSLPIYTPKEIPFLVKTNMFTNSSITQDEESNALAYLHANPIVIYVPLKLENKINT